LAFDADALDSAFKTIRDRENGQIVIEARNQSWASDEAFQLLKDYAFDRVFADPSPVWQREDFDAPPVYLRLHGKPRIYHSSYTDEEIRSFAHMSASDSWCVFDNTASGAATKNALAMLDSL
jgi:uncharacterized protein YecE (DUF72 family)